MSAPEENSDEFNAEARAVLDTLAVNVKFARLRAGYLTQAAFAEATGLGQAAISQIEKGIRSVRLDSLLRLSFVLRVPVTDLFNPTYRARKKRKNVGRVTSA